MGNYIKLEGKFVEPEEARNYKGFSYKNYLKTKAIFGTIKINKLENLVKKDNNIFLMIREKIRWKISKIISSNLKHKQSNIMKGILLGDTSQIDEETKEKFKIANISHILAISGMHVTYIVLSVELLVGRILGKRKTYYIKILTLIIYMIITGFSPSITRAGIMGILVIVSKLIYKQVDLLTSMSISVMIILIKNPYSIMDIGLQFSYLAVISIIVFYSILKESLNKILEKYSKKKNLPKLKKLSDNRILDIIFVTVSVQIIVLPISIYYMNIINPYFIITNLLVGIIIGPIVLISIILIIFSIIFSKIVIIKKEFYILEKLIDILLMISNLSEIPFSKLYIPTPRTYDLIVYYFILLIAIATYMIYVRHPDTNTSKRCKNLISVLKYKIYYKNYYNKRIILVKIITLISLIILIFNVIIFINKDLEIHFVDVGQGDCSFIITPMKKTILIDGGGSQTKDLGKSTLLPYILDRGFNKIDYIFITHFDTDHVKGLLTIMKEINVKRVFISAQVEESNNYKEFVNIIKKKNIKYSVLKRKQKIKIEKGVEINVLWPESDKKEKISKISKPLNNNSLVLKLEYKNFSMLFTGDIEKEAEERIYEEYKREEKRLKSDILKVAHHGSKTSTYEKMLDIIDPKVALIGVGKDNMFGHPANEVIDRLNNRKIILYRTDKNGEVSIYVKNKNNIKIKSMYKNE